MSGHHHHHARDRIGIALLLNMSFTVVEFVGAWLTNSTAIAADAVHDLGDSISLAFAWRLQAMSDRGPDPVFTYGYRRLSLLGALVNAAVLIGGGLLVLSETVPRLMAPATPHAPGMIGLAVVGVLVNGAAVVRVQAGSSLNERVVTWHLLEDVLGWVAVLVAGLVMLVTDLPILDPLLSIGITLWVGYNGVKNLRSTLDVFLQAVPADVNIEALRGRVLAVAGVRDLRHLHIWSQEGEHHVLTGQLEVRTTSLAEAIAVRDRTRACINEAGIDHVTLEIVTSTTPHSTHPCGYPSKVTH